MTTKVNRHTMTTPDGHTVRATYCHAIIECGTPDGATQLTGALVPVAAGVTYAHLVPNATFTADGLEALGAVTRAVSDSMTQDSEEQPDPETDVPPRDAVIAEDWDALVQLSGAILDRAEKAEKERDELRDAVVTVLPGNQDGMEYWRARALRVERERDQLAVNLRGAKAERPAILADLHKLVDQWATEPDVKQRGSSARTQLQAIIACYTPEER